MTRGKNRQSNIELLRIVSMLMIIGLHLLDKGRILPDVKGSMNINGYIAWLLEALFLSSVNVFFLISGYFSANIELTLKKVFKFWIQVASYSAILGFVAVAIGLRTLDIYVVFQYIFPLVTNHYWFATVYIVLLVLAPLLNKGVDSIDKKAFGLILGLLVIFSSVSKTLIPMNLATDEYGYNVTWMLTVYLIGMYIRKYVKFSKKRATYFLAYLGSSFIIFLSMILVRTLYIKRGMLPEFITWGYSYNFLFCLIASVSLFAFFVKKADFTGKTALLVNKIAGATFGVYLFHEHMDIRYLWPKAFGCENYINSNTVWFILEIAITIIIIFILGTLLELFRQSIFDLKNNIDILVSAFLIIYALRNSFKGLDLMDSSYALGNYKYFDSMNPTWKFATYLSNVIGAGMMRLPGGDTWVGMNLYTGMVLALTAVVIYHWLSRKYADKKHVIITGVIIGLSLCWAPSTILYHYLSFIVMSIVVMLLVEGIKKDAVRYFLISGMMLGCAIFLRLPNVTYVILILPVIYGLYEKDLDLTQRWQKIGIRFLQCIAGFVIGAIPIYLYIGIRYGFSAYTEMVGSLFGMTEKATDYKPTSMLTQMFGTYIKYLPWFALFAAFTIIGVLFFRFVKLKHEKIWKALYILAFVLMIRMAWGRGYFGLDYKDMFAVIKPFATFITAVIILCLYNIFNRKVDKDKKILSAFLLTMTFVSPLGGNNHIYSVMENMIFIAPASLVLIHFFEKEKKSFCLSVVVRGFVLLLFIQTVAFGNEYVFHDLNERSTIEVSADIHGSRVTDGLSTDFRRKLALNELGEYLDSENMIGKKVILYGDIPGISYIFGMEPAVYTSWPDLDSNVAERLKKDLDNMTITPVIITSKDTGKRLLMPSNIEDEKETLIHEFMENKEYYCSFFNDEFYVFTVK